MLDRQIAHGATPADWDWASVPYATNCDDQPDEYGGCVQDMPREFHGGIETDKLGELGIGYVLFYEMTGEQKISERGHSLCRRVGESYSPRGCDAYFLAVSGRRAQWPGPGRELSWQRQSGAGR
jgi:hypothetical protein